MSLMWRMTSSMARMTAALEAGGLDTSRRVFVLWLGVTPYLTEEAVFATLAELARFSGGAEVVFDYPNPPDAIEEREVRASRAALAARVAAIGEPFRCHFDTDALHRRARSLGFAEIEDLDRAALVARYLPRRPSARAPARAAMSSGWRRGREARGGQAPCLWAKVCAHPLCKPGQIACGSDGSPPLLWGRVRVGGRAELRYLRRRYAASIASISDE